MQQISRYPDTYYRISLKAVIRNEKGDVLVCKEHGNDKWSLPGGGWDHQETEAECLARELYEEVGYKGTFSSRLIGTTKLWMHSHSAYLVWLVYEIVPDHYNFSVGQDADEIAFVNPEIFKDSAIKHHQYMYDLLTVS